MALHKHISLIVLSIAATMMVSCRKESVTALCEDSQISFVTDDSDTRATIITTDRLKTVGNKFRVDAFLEKAERPAGYNDDPHFIKNKPVTWNGSEWTSGSFWIHNVYTNFWARYPETKAPTMKFDGSGLYDGQQKSCSFEYEMPEASGTVYAANYCADLIYGYARKRTDLTEDTPDLSVKINFRHVLSAIGFTCNLSPGIDIKKITIKGIYTQGTCRLTGNPSFSGDNYNDSFDVNWTVSGTKEESGLCQSVSKEDIDDGQMLVPDGTKVFTLIPQTLTSDAKVVVTFCDSDGTNEFDQTASLRGSGLTWSPGQKYNYVIMLIGNKFDISLTSESVDTWEIRHGELDGTK